MTIICKFTSSEYLRKNENKSYKGKKGFLKAVESTVRLKAPTFDLNPAAVPVQIVRSAYYHITKPRLLKYTENLTTKKW